MGMARGRGLWAWQLVAMGHKITNIPQIWKIRDIIFCFWAISLLDISRDILRGLQLFDP